MQPGSRGYGATNGAPESPAVIAYYRRAEFGAHDDGAGIPWQVPSHALQAQRVDLGAEMGRQGEVGSPALDASWRPLVAARTAATSRWRMRRNGMEHNLGFTATDRGR
jgi:hypothetical protein